MSKEALELAQQYDRARNERLALDKQVEKMKEGETALKQQLMDMLQAEGINSVGDKDKVYALVQKTEPVAEDFAKLYAHIQKSGEFELLFRRINPAAVKERWEDGIEVPGVGKFLTLNLSITKAKGAK